ncbi:MAG TPA: DUF5714 domain-containing protein [Bacteroidota bacterium]|nr:DUF5714 domain-containing protein [Bacteroidota bacterium]
MDYKSGCLVCGAELEYTEHHQTLRCFYCGTEHDANAACRNGHYICDSCHSASANDLIEQYCNRTQESDPIGLANNLMHAPSIKMHGPEHHFLVPAVLIAAWCNALKVSPVEKREKIAQAKRRAGNILGGFCGFYGNCGAAVGTGICVSVMTNATPLSNEEWGLCNRMTAESLLKIAACGGPRCCKRDSYLAILQASELIQRQFHVPLSTTTQIQCQFHSHNAQCIGDRCPFHSED